MQRRPAVLVIAGADSSGGAGLVRDVGVLGSLDVDVLCAVTAVTVQSDSRTAGIHHVPPQIVREQIGMACATRTIHAIKIGMLGTRATVEAVVESLPSRDAVPIVLDPVLAATSGGELLDREGRVALREQLLPRVTLLTPNIPEAAALLQEEPGRDSAALLDQARRLLALGPQAVLLKGGHAVGKLRAGYFPDGRVSAGAGNAGLIEHDDAGQPNPLSGALDSSADAEADAIDYLVSTASQVSLALPRHAATRRGTGCALACAIAASLAHGKPLLEACQLAKRYLWKEMKPALP